MAAIKSTLAAILVTTCIIAATSMQAATLEWSTTAPTVDGADIANLIGTTTDATNINGGGDDGTYVAGNRPAVGQTFTTGGNVAGYTLSAITLQQVQYATDTTFWSVDAGWGAGNPFEIQVGTKDGTTSFTALSTETAITVVSGINALDVAGGQSGVGTGAFSTFTLGTPILLDANTTYGFTVFSPGPYFETNGDGTTSTNYSGGEAFGVAGPTITDYIGDHVFHLDLTANLFVANAWAVDADGNWNTAGNWTLGVPGPGSDPLLGNIISDNRSVTLDSNVSLNSLTLFNPVGDGDYFVVPATTQKLTLTGDAEINSAGRHWLRAPVAGSSGLNATGSGELVLDANNTFTGGLNVSGANVAIVNNAAIPVGNNITIENGGQLRFYGPDNGFFVGTNGAPGYGTGTLNQTVSLDSSGALLQVNDGADLTFAGIISGAGKVEVNNATGTFTAPHTFTGEIQGINDGVIEVSTAGKLGVSDGTVANGTILSQSSQLSLSNVSLGSEFIFLDASVGTNQAKIASSGTSSISGNIFASQFGNGVYQISSASAGTLTLSGILSAADDEFSTRTYVFNGGGNINITGRITDDAVDADGNLTGPSLGDNVEVVKRGSGTLTVGTNDTDDYWRGNTTVEGGALVLTVNGSSNNTLFSPVTTVKHGAMLDISGFSTYELGVADEITGGGTFNVGSGVLLIYEDNIVTPGDGIGTLSVTGRMNMQDFGSGSGAFNYQLGNDNEVIGGSENDLITISGTLTGSSSAKFNIQAIEGSLEAGEYRLINHLGGSPSFSGSVQAVDAEGNPLNIRQSLIVTTTTNQVNLNVGGSAANLFWKGAPNNNWSTAGTANFGLNSVGGSNSNFLDLDNVTFGNGAISTTVNVASNVAPGTMTVNGGNYTFTGSDINAASVTVSGGANASFSNHVGGNVTVANTGTLAGRGTFKNNVNAQSGSTITVGNAGLPSSPTALAITNGDFETGAPAKGTVADDVTAPWFDEDGTNFYDHPWLENRDSASFNDTAIASLSALAANETFNGADQFGYLYQSLGMDASAGLLSVSFDWGLLDDSPGGVGDLGITLGIYESNGSFVPGASTDVLGGNGITLVDEVSLTEVNVPQGGSFSDIVTFNLSTQSGGELFLRINNFLVNGMTDDYLAVDNLEVIMENPESMKVQGDLSLDPGSTIAFGIASAGINDVVDIGGELSVADGFILDVTLSSGVPASSLQAGDSWDLFDFASASGTFDKTEFLLPSLSGNLAWDTSQLLVDGTLSITVSGDFDGDGDVDGADFLLWQRNPGIGNLADWEANYGAPLAANLTAASTAVPEPTGLFLLALGLGALAMHRKS